MTQNEVIEKLKTLPPEAKQQVIDFIAFLETRYRPIRKKSSRGRLSEEKFIGIWQGRADLRDSTTWVKALRKKEWESTE